MGNLYKTCLLTLLWFFKFNFLRIIFLYGVKNVNTTGSLTNFQLFKQVSIVLCIPSKGALKSLICNWWQVAAYFVLSYPILLPSHYCLLTVRLMGWLCSFWLWCPEWFCRGLFVRSCSKSVAVVGQTGIGCRSRGYRALPQVWAAPQVTRDNRKKSRILFKIMRDVMCPKLWGLTRIACALDPDQGAHFE